VYLPYNKKCFLPIAGSMNIRGLNPNITEIWNPSSLSGLIKRLLLNFSLYYHNYYRLSTHILQKFFIKNRQSLFFYLLTAKDRQRYLLRSQPLHKILELLRRFCRILNILACTRMHKSQSACMQSLSLKSERFSLSPVYTVPNQRMSDM